MSCGNAFAALILRSLEKYPTAIEPKSPVTARAMTTAGAPAKFEDESVDLGKRLPELPK